MPEQAIDSLVAAVPAAPPTSSSEVPTTDTATAQPVTRRLSRRRFIAAAGATAVAVSTAAYYSGRRSVKLGLIGAGGRGSYHAWLLKWLSYGGDPYGKVVAICDADTAKAESVRQSHWSSAQVYQDYRQLLARDDVEAVFVVTPDHWHAGIAIAAMQAGKAVYVEKPVTLTIEEGFRLREVAEQTGSIVQVGTQQRSHTPFHDAWALVNNGRIGQLKKATVLLGEQYIPSDSCTADSSKMPGTLDWNLWLGPTADVDYCQFRHLGWGYISDYTGGMITNWGSHHFDIALWTCGLHNTYPSVVDGKGTIPALPVEGRLPKDFDVSFQYPGNIAIEMRTSTESNGILFVGDKGRILVNRGGVSGKPVEELRANPLPADAVRPVVRRVPGPRQKLAEIQHYRDFFDCIATRNAPVSDVNSSVCVVTALHLANISIALGRPVHFDAGRRMITDDPLASAMASRPRRTPFLI